MKKITLYQTLKDKDYLNVEANGPFPCRWENTWLGDGYYFWQEFIELAHWWGQSHRNGNYIVCEAECDFDESKCLDLVGEMSHVRLFQDAIQIMRVNRKITPETTVSRIINFMKGEFESFLYEAIRVYGINSISPNKEASKQYSSRFLFEINKGQYLDALPAVQLCLFTKNSLNLRNYKITYPDHYREDYEDNYVI